ncbi:hypothetical protein M0R45_034327 [Rubus argutus]|uniref:t-SNARE coiled-coil homology domain-containing protein n=1 Tax=Rubus argutus TaxID=59490 RepID=A0AAW1VTG7_RUBAR
MPCSPPLSSSSSAARAAWPTLREVFHSSLGQWKSQVWNENAWKLPVVVVPWIAFGSFIVDEEAHLSRVRKLEDARTEDEQQFAELKQKIKHEFEEEMLEIGDCGNCEKQGFCCCYDAEVRRTKARLLEELPKLRRLAPKKNYSHLSCIGERLSKEDLEARSDIVSVLKERIDAIPDGSTNGVKQTGGWTDSTSSYTGIKIYSTSDGRSDSEYFQQTEESDRFRNEYEIQRMKQDQGLDVIAEGRDTLKHKAGDMNKEIDRQLPLMDEIDDKVERAKDDLKNTYVRPKNAIIQLRSSRNFCINIILLCLISGIAAYLYK